MGSRCSRGSNPGPHLLNPMGTVHGGWALTLLSSVTGCAAFSLLPPGSAYTTIDKANFSRPIRWTLDECARKGVWCPLDGKCFRRGARAAGEVACWRTAHFLTSWASAKSTASTGTAKRRNASCAWSCCWTSSAKARGLFRASACGGRGIRGCGSRRRWQDKWPRRWEGDMRCQPATREDHGRAGELEMGRRLGWLPWWTSIVRRLVPRGGGASGPLTCMTKSQIHLRVE